jgi:hypothetical protein
MRAEPRGTDQLLTANILVDLDLDAFCDKFIPRAPSLAVRNGAHHQLVEHPRDRSAIIAMWRLLYEEETWIDLIERGAGSSSGRRTQTTRSDPAAR